MPTPHLRRLVTTLAIGLLLLLAACGRQAAIDTSYVVTGTVAAFDDAVATAIAYAMVDAAVLDMGGKIASSSFVELEEEGLFLGPVAAVAADGSFELTFPEPSDVPEATLAPADGFLWTTGPDPACTLVASDAEAQVSALLFDVITLPGLVGFTLDGASLGIVSDVALDWGAESEAELIGDATLITWIYADRAVDVGVSAACAEAGLAVDLSLGAGWNQIGISIDVEEERITFANDDTDDVVVQLLSRR